MVKKKEQFERDCRLHIDMVLAHIHERSWGNDGFGENELNNCTKLAHDIFDDYISAWPEIPLHTCRLVATLCVYSAWKIGDFNFRWGWSEHSGGSSNATVRKRLDEFVTCISKVSDTDYQLTNRGKGNTIKLKRQIDNAKAI